MEKEGLEKVKNMVIKRLKDDGTYDELVNLDSAKMLIDVEVDEHDKTKLNVSYSPPVREMSFEIKLAFKAKSFWEMRLMCIGGCRFPRGMQ
ncbi:hypothetical protein J2S82_003407 [Aeromonas caviae]|uniref:hypothetical protein n=1 Tax=Aeromonas caviae TaxID=648 RepID=UPI0020A031B0|nr:hypothetical protein [Aeromonas caviae]MCP1601450.1 hypothetical protein [Aeromonas caviae]